VYLALALASGARGKHDEVIGYSNQALEMDPDYAEAYGLRGQAQIKKGHLDQAIEDYRQSA